MGTIDDDPFHGEVQWGYLLRTPKGPIVVTAPDRETAKYWVEQAPDDRTLMSRVVPPWREVLR